MVWSWVGRNGVVGLVAGSLIACGQSHRRVEEPVGGDAGGESGAVAGGGGEDATGSGGDAGFGGLGGAAGAAGDAQGGSAGDGGDPPDVEGGAGGRAGAGGDDADACATDAIKLGAEDAESAVRAQAGEPSTLRLTELELESAWERFELQIFVSDPDVAGLGGAFAFYGGHYWRALPSGFSGFRSALVTNDAVFYTYGTGSGVARAHVVRLSFTACMPEVLQSGGYSKPGLPDLFLRQEGEEIHVESGRFVAFNQWRDGEFYGRLVSDETALSIVDATGMTLEPEFAPP